MRQNSNFAFLWILERGMIMSRKKGLLYGSLMTAVFSMAMIFSSFAGVISSVRVYVDSDLNPGDKLPDISIHDDSSFTLGSGDIVVYVETEQYKITSAEWVTSKNRTMEVGYEPELKVTLTPSNADDYYFKGSYRSSNVTVKRGTFVSASLKNGELTVRLKAKPIKGTFGEPSDAYWRDNTKGTARWVKPDDDGTGTYEVVLRRGSTQVHRVETSSTSYNFYPYMTSAGTYTFRVRTIGKTSKETQYGTKSAWVESDELYIAREDVSDGTGASSTGSSGGPSGNTNVGWRYNNSYWYYYYPDGSYEKNRWLLVNDKWYLFQEDGKMLRGWQNKGGHTYYLTDNGDMVTGWVRSGSRWYYLNASEGSGEGAMLKNCWGNINGQTYYLTSDGSMAEGWYQVDGNWYYFYPGQGNKAVNTHIDTFYVDGDGVWRR